MDSPDRPLDPVAFALLGMFGSLLLGIAVGAIVGHFTRFEAGAAVALLALAAGGLGGAARVAWYLHHESAVVTLSTAACVEGPGSARTKASHALRYGLVLPDGRELSLQAPELGGPCPEGDDDRETTLRYRLADAAPGGPALIAAEPELDPRSARVLPWVFVAFGGFGLLAGLFFIASVRAQRRRERLGPAADAPPVVSERRIALSGHCNLMGALTVVVAALGFAFVDQVAGMRSEVLVFAAIPLACTFWALGFAARGLLRAETALILLIVGSGFAAAAWSLAVLGP